MSIENNVWYDIFLDTLNKKYPKKQDLLQALMDLLFIEREAVYRRLRRDVIFTAYEIAKIAIEWNISLDTLIGIDSGQVPFQMRQINYLDPSVDEMKFLWTVVQGIHLIKNYPDTEFMDIGNKLPRQILAGYDYLNQFYLFKWQYQYYNDKEVLPFSQAVNSEAKTKLTTEYYQAIKTVPSSNFIWDRRLFESLVSDIRYFVSINMITEEEKHLIKKDLNDLLDYLFTVASEGCYPETKNSVTIYISELNIDTNYSYTFSREANICFVHVFEKYELYTFEPKMVLLFKDWMQAKKKSSIQISVVDERSRIEYFTKQRQIVDEL
jgi:hypothetical protein